MKKLLPIIGAGILSLLLFLFVVPASSSNQVVKVSINNPYRFAVHIEVKCDWNHKAQSYHYYKKIKLKSRQATTVILPKFVKNCELWPRVKFL